MPRKSGGCDVYYAAPSHVVLRSRVEVAKYIGANKAECSGVTIDQFCFSKGGVRARAEAFSLRSPPSNAVCALAAARSRSAGVRLVSCSEEIPSLHCQATLAAATPRCCHCNSQPTPPRPRYRLRASSLSLRRARSPPTTRPSTSSARLPPALSRRTESLRTRTRTFCPTSTWR